ncbi:MAG: hypothetical protein IAE79_05865 [Anaerolinea sp.]|nr:hypothetical protein [Anaerolinea sp.]
MVGGKSSPRRVTIAQRRERAVKLRKVGHSFRDIAAIISAEMGINYTKSTAERDVSAVLAQTNERTAEKAEEFRTLQMERLDDVLRTWWSLAVDDPVSSTPTKEEKEEGEGETAVITDEYQAVRAARTGILKTSLSRVYDLLKDLSKSEVAVDPSELRTIVNTMRVVVSELRAEAETPEKRPPDAQAARLVLDVIDRQNKLVGLEKLVVELPPPARSAADDLAAAIANLSEEQIENTLANFQDRNAGRVSG